jgi:steroid 5-alpha reductase family enzyme
MSSTHHSRSASIAIMAVAYLLAVIAGVASISYFNTSDPLWAMIYADLVATVVIFIFSVSLNNSSLYDPYWSIIPMGIVPYWAFFSDFDVSIVSRLATILVCTWGLRLTWNFLRGWPGLVHEDWRYINIREFSKKLYWPASFLGIHLFPTAIVFAGLYPIYLALAAPDLNSTALVYAGAALGFLAIVIETAADEQLRKFVLSGPEKGSYLKSGLWSIVRHPNYLGENLFWWSLAIIGFGATGKLVCFGGAIAMTAMFVFASIPMIDKRMLERRPAYAEHKAKTPALFPWKGIKPS